MALRKRPVRTENLGADFSIDGVSVLFDWRYDVVMDYLYASHSFQAVLKHKQGKKSPYRLPLDFALVEATVNDFGDFREIGEQRWWDTKGKYLFGIKAPMPSVQLLGELKEAAPQLTRNWSGIDTAILEIPLHLTPVKAIQQVKKLLESLQLSAPIASNHIAPKYLLKTNRLRRHTLEAGAEALKRYNQSWPLWKIGNWLRLIPTLAFDEHEAEEKPYLYDSHKKSLATVARRLVSFAALVAENAARGRFLTNEAFPEAMLDTYQRSPGRPKGSTHKR